MLLFPTYNEETKEYFIPAGTIPPFAVRHGKDDTSDHFEYFSSYLIPEGKISLQDLIVKPVFGNDSNIQIDLSSLAVDKILLLIEKGNAKTYLPINAKNYWGSRIDPNIDIPHREREINFTISRLVIQTFVNVFGEAIDLLEPVKFGLEFKIKFDGVSQELYFKSAKCTADESVKISLVGVLLHTEVVSTDDKLVKVSAIK